MLVFNLNTIVFSFLFSRRLAGPGGRTVWLAVETFLTAIFKVAMIHVQVIAPHLPQLWEITHGEFKSFQLWRLNQIQHDALSLMLPSCPS